MPCLVECLGAPFPVPGLRVRTFGAQPSEPLRPDAGPPWPRGRSCVHELDPHAPAGASYALRAIVLRDAHRCAGSNGEGKACVYFHAASFPRLLFLIVNPKTNGDFPSTAVSRLFGLDVIQVIPGVRRTASGCLRAVRSIETIRFVVLTKAREIVRADIEETPLLVTLAAFVPS